MRMAPAHPPPGQSAPRLPPLAPHTPRGRRAASPPSAPLQWLASGRTCPRRSGLRTSVFDIGCVSLGRHTAGRGRQGMRIGGQLQAAGGYTVSALRLHCVHGAVACWALGYAGQWRRHGSPAGSCFPQTQAECYRACSGDMTVRMQQHAAAPQRNQSPTRSPRPRTNHALSWSPPKRP